MKSKTLHDWVKHQFEATGDKSSNVVENNSAGKNKVGEAGQASIYSMYDSAGENYLRLFNTALYIMLGEKPFADFGDRDASDLKQAFDDVLKGYMSNECFTNLLVSNCADGASVKMGKYKNRKLLHIFYIVYNIYIL